MLIDREDIAVLCYLPSSDFSVPDAGLMLRLIVTGGFEGEVKPYADSHGVIHDGCPAHLTEMHVYLENGHELLLGEAQMALCERAAIQTLRHSGVIRDEDAEFLESQRV